MDLVPQWVIEKKRDGAALSSDEIAAFIAAYADESLPDYQMAALAMAIYLQGMNPAEVAALTQAMMDSGDVIDTSAITRPKVDKHSTGGIGDKVSLVLAPIAAACGLAVPMISGRGLGITGGTLDKMEAISGYRTDLDIPTFLQVVDACGCSIIGQTADLAPADKKLYALRDVTATVPSIPLITASIMGKKLAEGLNALVLDVKHGRGAFMPTQADARALAQSMIDVGTHMGKKVTAVLTDMDEPLGCAIGNALEVVESIECLRGKGPDDLMEVTRVLTAHMITAGLGATYDEALAQVNHAITSGAAYEQFVEMVRLHGGDVTQITDPSRLPAARNIVEVCASHSGMVTDVDPNLVGRGVLVLGAGRRQSSDPVDHAVGVDQLVKTGTSVSIGDVLMRIHANDDGRLVDARTFLNDAVQIGDTAPPARQRITETLYG